MSKKGAHKSGSAKKRKGGHHPPAPPQRMLTLSAFETRMRGALGFDMKPLHGGASKVEVKESPPVKKKGFKKRW